MVKIMSETALAAGIRRIEALVADEAFEYFNGLEEKFKRLAGSLKCPVTEVEETVNKMAVHFKEAEKENTGLKRQLASIKAKTLVDKAVEAGQFKLIVASLDGITEDDIRGVCDILLDRIKSGVVIISSKIDPKVIFAGKASDDAVAAGVHVGKLIGEVAKLCGGGGGGKPNMAMAGGKNPDAAAEALEKALNALKTILTPKSA